MSVEDEQSWVRLAAVEEVKSLVDLRSRALDEHAHAFRWLTASLLAINSGGAIAALNSEYLAAMHKIFAGGLFGLGLLAALLVGVLAQHANRKIIPTLQKQLGYWVSVADDGERLESMEADFAVEMKVALKGAWLTPMVGWVSAILFLSGIGMMGVDLVDREISLNKHEAPQNSTVKSHVANR